MEILSVFKAVLAPEKDQTADSFAFLKPGDKLIGKVVRLEADGRALIDLGGVRALAQTTVPVEVGQQLPLKVIQVGQPIHLRLDETATSGPQPAGPQLSLGTLLSPNELQRVTQVIDRLLALTSDSSQITQPQGTTASQGTALQTPIQAQSAKGLEAGGGTQVPEPVRNALMMLRSAFEPLPMDAPVARRSEWVQSAVENRGVLFEVKLANALEKVLQPPLPEPPAGAASAPVSDPMAAGRDTQAGIQGKVHSDAPSGPALMGEQFVEFELASDITTNPKAQTAPAASAGDAPSDAELAGNPAKNVLADKALRVLAQDLKPQLLLLKSHLGIGSPDVRSNGKVEPIDQESELLRQVVDRVLGHVEQQQQQAVRRAGQSEVYQVFTHLLPVKDQSMPVRLKVYYPNKGGPARDDPQHRIALLLDMDQLGMVRADLAMVERQLRIQFFVQDESVQHLFAEHAQIVAQALKPVFQQVHINTQVSREKIDRFDGEDLQGPPLGRIDVKA